MPSSRRLVRTSCFFLVACTIYLIFRHLTMRPTDDIESIANDLLEPKGLKVVTTEPLQSLWAGYGQIVRLKASPVSTQGRSTGATAAKSESLTSDSIIIHEAAVTYPQTRDTTTRRQQSAR